MSVGYLCVMLRKEEYRHYRLAIGFCLLLALIVAFFLGYYGKEESFLIINKYNSPGFDYFFEYFTYLGDGIIWVPLFVYVFIWRKDFLLTTIVALIICTVLTHFMKRVVFPEEFRPIVVLQDKVRIINGLKINRANSFPSGHTSTAFTYTLLLVFLLRKQFWTFFFPLVAFFVGYSRVYLAQHFVTDVFAGMLVGIVSSFLALMFYESRRNKLAAAGKVSDDQAIIGRRDD